MEYLDFLEKLFMAGILTLILGCSSYIFIMLIEDNSYSKVTKVLLTLMFYWIIIHFLFTCIILININS
tara:strand:+ start:9928 stop:10131 length:204 start_codon:yes stop_codon:yes gene_type:complete